MSCNTGGGGLQGPEAFAQQTALGQANALALSAGMGSLFGGLSFSSLQQLPQLFGQCNSPGMQPIRASEAACDPAGASGAAGLLGFKAAPQQQQQQQQQAISAAAFSAQLGGGMPTGPYGASLFFPGTFDKALLAGLAQPVAATLSSGGRGAGTSALPPGASVLMPPPRPLPTASGGTRGASFSGPTTTRPNPYPHPQRQPQQRQPQPQLQQQQHAQPCSSAASWHTPASLQQQLGEETFYLVRSLIIQQQEQFTQQVYELHRLHRVQQLLAAEVGAPDLDANKVAAAQRKAQQLLRSGGGSSRRGQRSGSIASAIGGVMTPRGGGSSGTTVAAAAPLRGNGGGGGSPDDGYVPPPRSPPQAAPAVVTVDAAEARSLPPAARSLAAQVHLMRNLPASARRAVSAPNLPPDALEPSRYWLPRSTAGVVLPQPSRVAEAGSGATRSGATTVQAPAAGRGGAAAAAGKAHSVDQVRRMHPQDGGKQQQQAQSPVASAGGGGVGRTHGAASFASAAAVAGEDATRALTKGAATVAHLAPGARLPPVVTPPAAMPPPAAAPSTLPAPVGLAAPLQLAAPLAQLARPPPTGAPPPLAPPPLAVALPSFDPHTEWFRRHYQQGPASSVSLPGVSGMEDDPMAAAARRAVAAAAGLGATVPASSLPASSSKPTAWWKDAAATFGDASLGDLPEGSGGPLTAAASHGGGSSHHHQRHRAAASGAPLPSRPASVSARPAGSQVSVPHKKRAKFGGGVAAESAPLCGGDAPHGSPALEAPHAPPRHAQQQQAQAHEQHEQHDQHERQHHTGGRHRPPRRSRSPHERVALLQSAFKKVVPRRARSQRGSTRQTTLESIGSDHSAASLDSQGEGGEGDGADGAPPPSKRRRPFSAGSARADASAGDAFVSHAAHSTAKSAAGILLSLSSSYHASGV